MFIEITTYTYAEGGKKVYSDLDLNLDNVSYFCYNTDHTLIQLKHNPKDTDETSYIFTDLLKSDVKKLLQKVRRGRRHVCNT